MSTPREPTARHATAPVERDPAEWACALEQARTMFDAWLDRDGGRWIYGDRPADTPEGKAILDSSPLIQIAAIRLAMATMTARLPASERDVQTGVSRAALDRQRKARELLGVLLRRKQLFVAEDTDAVLAALDTRDAFQLYLAPVPLLLRNLSLAVRPGHWPAAQRAALERLLRLVSTESFDREKRLRISCLLREMLDLPEEPEVESEMPRAVELPPQIETDSEALRRVAAERIDGYLQDALSAPNCANWATITRGILEPTAHPDSRALIEGDAALQLAAWEVATRRILEIKEGVGQDVTEGHMVKRVQQLALTALLGQLLDRSLASSVADVARVLKQVVDLPRDWRNVLCAWTPIARLVQRIEDDGLSQPLCAQLRELRDWLAPHAGNYGVRGTLLRLDYMLADGRPNPIEAVDDWGYAARAALNTMGEPRRSAWSRLLIYLRDCTGSKPTARWLNGARPLIAALGADAHLELTAA